MTTTLPVPAIAAPAPPARRRWRLVAGSRRHVAERLAAYAESGVTTLNVTPVAHSAPERVALVGEVKELAAAL